MLKTKPNPGTKIRCMNDGGHPFITRGKIYEVIKGGNTPGERFAFRDDDGDECWHEIGESAEEFELVEEKETEMNNKETPDEFKVGDTVWCVLNGKGEVVSVRKNDNYPVEVEFENTGNNYYTEDGRYCDEYPRTLFFSEPKIEAAVKRPFTPTLIGKTVALKHSTYCGIIEVFYEDREAVRSTAGVEYHKSVYTFHEISPVNLLDNA